MPCNSICSHLINKVNRYLKQSEPYLCTHVNFLLSAVELILRMKGIWEKREKKTSPTQVVHVWVCCKQTAGITVMLLDSKSYWSLLLLIRIFPTHSQILPHRLCFWKIAFRQFKDASRTLKIILGEYYFKIRIDSRSQKWGINVGVEWSGEIRWWKMTLRHELSVSVAQRETSGWTRLQRTQTRLRRLHKLGADSLQNKRHQLCWLLTQFAGGLIQFQSRGSCNDLHVQKKLIALQKKRCSYCAW